MSAARQLQRGVFFIWLSAALLAWLLLSSGLLADIESKTWDMRQQALVRPEAHDPKIKIIMVDQSSIDHYARTEQIYWPWPRSLYNPVLLYLARAGARGVAFDMLFTESSTHVGDDKEFADVVASSLPVVSAVSARRDSVDGDPATEELFRSSQERRRGEIERLLASLASPRFPSATLPIPMLIEASPALGNVSAEADADKIFRHAALGARVGETPVLSLPAALYALVHPGSGKGEEVAPLAGEGGKLLVRFFGPEATYDTYSIAAVINSWLKLGEGKRPDIPLEVFKDAYVFVGTNAPGLLDLRPVPVAGNYPGVELNATVLDNLLHTSFYREVPPAAALALTALFLGLVALVSLRATRYQAAIILGAVLAWAGASFAFAAQGWWLPVVAPLLSSLYLLLLVFLLQYRVEGRQHRFIKAAFQHYVTPEVINQIVKDPSSLALGGERRELTIFFSDIAGFTSISERMEPAKLVAFLNTFLSEMTDILLASGGTIDKYEGDAIIAFWNAPLQVHDHEKRAVNAAIQCQLRLRELGQMFQRDFGVSLRMRIGIHTGPVTVGNFGSSTRFNYTVIGDAANLASRLEGVNKVFGTNVLVSGSTRRRAGDELAWRTVGQARVVGRQEPVQLFEPLHPRLDGAILSRLGEFDRARQLFEAGNVVEAGELFATFADDPVSRAYCARIASSKQLGETGFSPVWNLTEK